MHEKIEQLFALYTELTEILLQEVSDQARYLLRNVQHSLALIEGRDLPDDVLFRELITAYRGLHAPHAGLSELFIWDDDFDKRIEVNKALDRIKAEAHQIFWN